MRIDRLVLERNRKAVGSLDERSVQIAGDVALGPPGIRSRHMRLAILIKAALRRTHGDEVVESIAALDTHVIRDWPQPMRRIKVAVSLSMNGSPPQTFALVREEFLAKIVKIGALSIKKVTK